MQICLYAYKFYIHTYTLGYLQPIKEMCTHLSWLKFDFDAVTNLNNSFHSYNFNVYQSYSYESQGKYPCIA